MFTGIIQAIAIISSVEDASGGKKFILRSPFVNKQTKIGDSVSVSGCCLTVTEILPDNQTSFYVSQETLKTTKMSDLQKGMSINLELAMSANGRFDGHVVLGHVDEVGRVVKIEEKGEDHEVTIEISRYGSNFVIDKGSIAIDGISLTINKINRNQISVTIIPHTWKNTTLKNLDIKLNNLVNVEFDQMAKYMRKMVDTFLRNFKNNVG